MSTVLETITARALGRDVVGFSLITNVHGNAKPLSHNGVLEASRGSAEHVAQMVEGIVANLEPAQTT
jgi:purine nucleoside phosphorylase